MDTAASTPQLFPEAQLQLASFPGPTTQTSRHKAAGILLSSVLTPSYGHRGGLPPGARDRTDGLLLFARRLFERCPFRTEAGQGDGVLQEKYAP